jgi:hypothetical protein
MVDLIQAYWRSNRDEANFLIVGMKARKDVF